MDLSQAELLNHRERVVNSKPVPLADSVAVIDELLRLRGVLCGHYSDAPMPSLLTEARRCRELTKGE